MGAIAFKSAPLNASLGQQKDHSMSLWGNRSKDGYPADSLLLGVSSSNFNRAKAICFVGSKDSEQLRDLIQDFWMFSAQQRIKFPLKSTLSVTTTGPSWRLGLSVIFPYFYQMSETSLLGTVFKIKGSDWMDISSCCFDQYEDCKFHSTLKWTEQRSNSRQQSI